ncbi:MAG: BlaI/MecI/CopY family transcriptional regulator [Pirellulaceae bacterium]|nr:BlaI/MecI/CopY family transcriptional regulator [Pirellulaceae bacterium]
MSRRERQVLEILYRCGKATAKDVQEALPDRPANATVRTILRSLERKGQARHEYDGPRYIYSPIVSPTRAKRSAVKRLLSTFFDDSPEKAVATFMDVASTKLSPAEFDRIEEIVREARSRSRR